MLFSILVVVTVLVIPAFLAIMVITDMAQKARTQEHIERTFGINR